MPRIRRTGIFTASELRRRLPRRPDKLSAAITAYLDRALPFGTTWTFLADGGAIIVRLGRAHFLRFHVDGQPHDTEAGERLEAAGAAVATIRDLDELGSALMVWGLKRRPLATA